MGIAPSWCGRRPSAGCGWSPGRAAAPAGFALTAATCTGVAALAAREFEQLVMTILRQRWASYDRIALLRAFRTNGDLAAIAAIDREVEASTLVEALRTGSRRNGASYLASHASLGDELALALRDAIRRAECLRHIAGSQGPGLPAAGLTEHVAQLTLGD